FARRFVAAPGDRLEPLDRGALGGKRRIEEIDFEAPAKFITRDVVRDLTFDDDGFRAGLARHVYPLQQYRRSHSMMCSATSGALPLRKMPGAVDQSALV